MLKILSWNVNGLKSAIKNGFKEVVEKTDADIICLQETKITNEKYDYELDGYYQHYNYAEKAGYSGVAIFTKEKPQSILTGIPVDDKYDELENLDCESRVITLEYGDFYVVSVYVPCVQRNLDRRNFRAEFDYYFREHIEKLHNKKDVIICGDFNVCHQNIDISNLDKHNNLEVFADEDRGSFNELLDIGLIDTYRYMHPQMRRYTFWTNDIEDRINSEFGWRLDYILVSDYLKKDIRQANILTEVKGSDHCPIELVIRI